MLAGELSAPPFAFMCKPDPIVLVELPVIGQIIRDETWLEAERRGCPVSPDDCTVRENVCRVILRIGAQLRESAERMANSRPEMMA
jgi:hypothetical protein